MKKNIKKAFACFAILSFCLGHEVNAEFSTQNQCKCRHECRTPPSTTGIPDINVSNDASLYYDVSQFFTIGTGNLLRYEITNITPSSQIDPDPSTIIYINPASGVIINLVPLYTITDLENLIVTVEAKNKCGTASSTFTISNIGSNPP